MFSMIAIESGSVWNSGIVHAIWNVVIIGGEFGIESSVISLFGYIIVAGIAFFMIRSRKN